MKRNSQKTKILTKPQVPNRAKRKMKKTPEQTITDYYMAKAYEKGQREALRKLQKEIEREADQIDKVLDNGREILQQAQGYRFDRLYVRRHALFTKSITLRTISEKIYDELMKLKN